MSVFSSISLVLVSLNIFGCFSVVDPAYADLTKSVYQLKPVPVSLDNGFTTFRDNMAKVMGVNKIVLDTKEIQDWHKKEIIDAGKKINYGSPTETSRVTTLLLSFVCSSCRSAMNCTCLENFGCNPLC